MVCSLEQLHELQAWCNRVVVDKEVLNYAVALVRKTRRQNELAIGAGPRAGVALVRCAKAMALIEGRSYVITDDIQKVLLPSLRHRVSLTPESEIEGRQIDEVLIAMSEQVAAPRY